MRRRALRVRFPARGGATADPRAYACTSFGHRSHGPIWVCAACGFLFQWPMPSVRGSSRRTARWRTRSTSPRRRTATSPSAGRSGSSARPTAAGSSTWAPTAGSSSTWRARPASRRRASSCRAGRCARRCARSARPQREHRRARALRRDLRRHHDVGRGGAPPRPAAGAPRGGEPAAARRRAPPLDHRRAEPARAGARRALAVAHGHAPLLLRPSHAAALLEETGFRVRERRAYMHTVSADYLLRKPGASFPPLAPAISALRKVLPRAGPCRCPSATTW